MSADRETTARAVCAALRDADLPALLRVLHEDLQGDVTASLPFGIGGTHDGRDRMLSDCWGQVGRHYELAPEPEAFVPTEDGRLLVLGTYRGRARSTGRAVEARFAHLIAFTDGLVSGWWQATDSEAWLAALDEPVSPAARP